MHLPTKPHALFPTVSYGTLIPTVLLFAHGNLATMIGAEFRMLDLGFGVQCIGIGTWGFGVQGSGLKALGVRVSG